MTCSSNPKRAAGRGLWERFTRDITSLGTEQGWPFIRWITAKTTVAAPFTTGCPIKTHWVTYRKRRVAARLLSRGKTIRNCVFLTHASRESELNHLHPPGHRNWPLGNSGYGSNSVAMCLNIPLFTRHLWQGENRPPEACRAGAVTADDEAGIVNRKRPHHLLVITSGRGAVTGCTAPRYQRRGLSQRIAKLLQGRWPRASAGGLTAQHTVVHCLNYQMWMGGVSDHLTLQVRWAVPFGVGSSELLIDTIRLIGIDAISCTP